MIKLGSESETIEYKKSTSELKEGIISIAAILNKHNSGELYFGIRNNGTAIGQDISDKTLRDISQGVYNHIQPPIYPDISNVVIDDKDCIRVAFEGDNVPYYAYGKAYLRVADEDRVMSPQELEAYILKKHSNTDKWDSEPSGKTIDDVSDDALARYVNKANNAGRVSYTYTNKHDILKRLDLLYNKNINNTAKIMFSQNVDLEIQMAVFATDVRLTFLDIQRESGRLNDLIELAENYIKKTMRWRVEFNGSLQRKEIPEIPLDAIREALFNSFCHRNYKIPQNNEVAIFKNRIEIYNPGTFPEGLTPEDFIMDSENSVHRNPLLAKILYYSKDIESFGTGLRRITTVCKNANVEVEFIMKKLGFCVVFHRPEIVVDEMGCIVASNSYETNEY